MSLTPGPTYHSHYPWLDENCKKETYTAIRKHSFTGYKLPVKGIRLCLIAANVSEKASWWTPAPLTIIYHKETIEICCEDQLGTTSENSRRKSVCKGNEGWLFEDCESCNEVWDDCFAHWFIDYRDLYQTECYIDACISEYRCALLLLRSLKHRLSYWELSI